MIGRLVPADELPGLLAAVADERIDEALAPAIARLPVADRERVAAVVAPELKRALRDVVADGMTVTLDRVRAKRAR